MAEWKLSVAPGQAPTPYTNMWYAHNYAQRRTQARNVIRSHYAPDYAHDVAQEYAHAQPLVHEPFHVCEDHLPLSSADYNRPLHQYLAQYARTALQGHAYTTEHAHALARNQGHSSAPAHVHPSGRGRPREHLGPEGRHSLRKVGHTSSRSHTHSIDQSHALTDDHALVHVRANTAERGRAHNAEQGRAKTAGEQGRAFSGEQGRAYSGEQSRAYTGGQGRAYSGEQGRAYSSEQGRSYSGEQGRTYSGEQGRAYTGEQGRSYAVDNGRVYTVGEAGDPSVGLMEDVDLTSIYPFASGQSYTNGFRYINEHANRVHRTPTAAREQANEAHPNAQGQGYRARPHAHNTWAFYPDSAQSSEDEEESILEDDVRVDLPYTHHQCRGRGGGREDHGHGRGEHIIRRFHDPGEACEEEPDVNTVGLSYQQRADVCHTRGHGGSNAALGEQGEGPDARRGGLLLAEGLVREWVRAVGVVAASGTLVTLVLLGFGVYNMLITTLFLLFVLTTVALLIFLLMRRPPCCPCCQDPYDTSASAAGSTGSQAANITYLTETHGIVVKKWMKDSPPPYESPPDYSSLSPELIMDAKTLQELVGAPHPPQGRQARSPSGGVHDPAAASSGGRSPSPLCTTPLFGPPSFCDSPRSLTPTMRQEAKLLGVYDRPPSPPTFPRRQHPPSPDAGARRHPTAPLAVPPAGYGQTAPTPPPYDTLRSHPREGGRRKEDGQ